MGKIKKNKEEKNEREKVRGRQREKWVRYLKNRDKESDRDRKMVNSYLKQ